MAIYPAYEPNEPILDYCMGLGKYSLQDQNMQDKERESGGTEFEKHCIPVSRKVVEIFPNAHRLYLVAACSALLHDSVEKKYRIEVYDSFLKNPEIIPGKTYINDLLEASEYGKEISYVVNKLTHRKWLDEEYRDYIKNICSFGYAKQEIRELDTVAAIVKACDKFCNIEPEEKRLAKRLYTDKKIKARKKINMEGKVITPGNSYSTTYGPLFEKFLLIDSRNYHGEDFVDWKILRQLIYDITNRAYELTDHNLDVLLETRENRMILGQMGELSLMRQHYVDSIRKVDAVIFKEREKLEKRKAKNKK